MRAKDKCPSCFQPISPADFLCASCELILDPSQAPERAVGEVSVVRRMLEAPQRGLPANKPNPRPPRSAATEGMEGPTRRLDLGPELAGVPVVVATLTRKSLQLTELEAWIVSLIDGLSDANGLAKKAGLRELELRVVLRTLQEKQVIDFADEPLSDADLELPSVLGTLDEEPETSPGLPDVGANVDRRDGRFMAPPAGAAVAPPPPPPISPPVAQPTGRRGPVVRAGRAVPPPPPVEALVERPQPIVQGKAEPPVLMPVAPPFPGSGIATPPRSAMDRMPPGPPPPPPNERTDPRIAYTGPVNRKVLDALKKVKRVEPAPSTAPREEKEFNIDDVLARDTLQVALRMEQGGRLDEAIRFLEKSISQSPEAPSLYNRLGIIIMRERGDFIRAEVLIRKAIELAPDNTVYASNLQQVLSKQALRAHR